MNITKFLCSLLLILLTPSFVCAQQAQSLCITKKGAITTRLKCKSGETKLTASNLGAFGLQGATGATGATGETGPAGPRGLGNSDTIQSGQTITGIIGETMFPGSTGASMSIVVDYGVKIVAIPTSEHIIVKANAALLSACGGTDNCLSSSDRDTTLQAQCTGTAQAPTAPSGYVCIYPIVLLDVASNLQGFTYLDSPYGFQVFWVGGAGQKSVFGGTWAYTAP